MRKEWRNIFPKWHNGSSGIDNFTGSGQNGLCLDYYSWLINFAWWWWPPNDNDETHFHTRVALWFTHPPNFPGHLLLAIYPPTTASCFPVRLSPEPLCYLIANLHWAKHHLRWITMRVFLLQLAIVWQNVKVISRRFAIVKIDKRYL